MKSFLIVIFLIFCVHFDSTFGDLDTYSVQCSSLRTNGYVMIRDRPCKIMEMSNSKAGRHGQAKVKIVGHDMFTGKKYDDLCLPSRNIEVPIISRTEYQLIGIDNDGFSTLNDEHGNTRKDIRLPESKLGETIREKFKQNVELIVTVMSAVGEEGIVASKVP
ncbi:eukaryotic translation initiation factor 5A-1-like [Panonychus citri]|uniref:eukaryotic translation initiation factor 5A-1-like n=1 Tax=Panonychus citri TaxID=50023 RepID=UPI00230811E3|nr:eukaryotic translation initiation factor 5A-1-like [Panonychus citri]